MGTLFAWLWSKVRGAAALVLPMLGGAAGRVPHSLLFWGAHGVVLVALLAGLAYLNHHFDLPRYLRAPAEWLARLWLPLLFVLLYLNLWLVYGLWRVSRAENRPAPYPDIERAWDDLLAAMARAGLDPNRVPIFLVLGRPRSSGDAPLARAAGTEFVSLGDPDAAVRAVAGPQGVFITSTDCGLLAGLARWAKTTLDPNVPAPAAADLAYIPPTASAGGPEDPASESISIIPTEAPSPPPTKDPAELARLSARLDDLCGRLTALRQPFCPINGILAFVPEAATRSEATSGPAGWMLGRDVRQVRETLELICPVLPVICDAERVPGMPDLLKRLPPERRGQRLGRRLPYAPRLGPAERGDLAAGALAWVCESLVLRLGFKLLPAADIDGSAPDQFVRLSAAFFERRDALARLARELADEGVGPTWVGGWYFAATGRRPEQQAFLSDVLRQLLENQNLVAWTPDGRRCERLWRRRTRAGYLFGVAAALAAFAAAAWLLLG